MRAFIAWKLGVRDGWESPHELGMGYTWPDDRLNEAYDRGVNVGQFVGRIFKREG